MIYLCVFLTILAIVFVYDVTQKKHTIHRNFPVIGHLRNLLEKIGPELRQYWIANNREELPFSRRHRSWVYASSKQENNLTGFGTDVDMDQPGHVLIMHNMMPKKQDPKSELEQHLVMCKKIIGQHRHKPYQPMSIVNISAMSFGSLSAAAVEAMNRGAGLAMCYHNTGEGGFSKYHDFGADVVFQIGTGYFGVCDSKGNFDLQKLKELCQSHSNIKAIEIKLSQGAKPGKGGILPAAKMSKEISNARGIPKGQSAISPNAHSAFTDIKSMIGFIELITNETGLPVGIKSAVGKLDDWYELAYIMKDTQKGPDFVTIDGGEGGTGASPHSFADHVSLPFNEAFTSVYKIFKKAGLTDRVVFVGSGKLGLPANAIKAFAMGCDLINVAREAMLSIGCIQAQVCHTNRCPSGVATQNKWLQRGLDPDLKSYRCYNYIKQLRKEILEMSHACGHSHPSDFDTHEVLMATGDIKRYKTLEEIYGYKK